ncbi:GMC family oxidoreductase N-terminal domain-containing protein [Novosphingobium sp. MMS21-SN21R]|uniref:GMC family oxidoreductase n=1 Tax=Novosphingobium sp. MMS21-SN21R TaxID=2969298 RepID=UPI0028875661|nr:GMC family oxidoreductase N-terminal domain-containing protein [Novosphingobium sp. MMS21-SN21R]MDT0508538.1 GMC family oxidoreductase N-terminal domain-containing protein [Novosphingobium sp. MMS21-SN21R]
MTRFDADIIIVGGGSAGCALAGRLADAGVDTLLVEAGKPDTDLRTMVPALTVAVVNNPDYDRGITAEPDDTIGGRQDIWPAARRLGGGSAINGMIYVRGHRRDYDRWAELGATGWAYDDVLPYFRRMETNSRGGDTWRGDSGPIAVSDNRVSYPVIGQFIDAAAAFGIPRNRDHNGEKSGEGTDYSQATQSGGLRCSAARGYLRGKLSRSTLRVMTETEVLRVVIEQGRATGIVIRRHGTEKTLRARKGVVLSAGTLNTPRLLMLSGIGPADELQRHGIACVADSPEVGSNLQEHVGTHLIAATHTRSINSDIRGLAAVGQGLDFVFRRRGAITSSMCHAQAFAHSSAAEGIPDVQISLTAFAFEFSAQGRAILLDRPAVSVTVSVGRPKARGRITLRSARPEDPPIIKHRLLAAEEDVERLARAIEIGREILAQAPIAASIEAELRPGPEVTGTALRAFVRQAAVPLYHPVGTCRMGSDATSVVDPELRVRGVDRLWVVDASVMPSLPIGNTNATVIMIGEKASDHLLRAIAL